ncbi:ATP-binding protein [Pleomorphovibrio marinus]|uniref:ATP-binding protein n=1 Tax=Pleomorphovibrio marinus TaxID=2164132 RepID=UPI0018E52FD6|nr:ATP-binding protein [Pleomorphovibrio marinus]
MDVHIDNINGALNAGQVNRALFLLDSAYSSFQELGFLYQWKKNSLYAMIYLNFDKDLKKAERYVDSLFFALEGREKTYKEEFAKSHFIKGDLFRLQNRHQEAMRSYYQGWEFARLYLDPCKTSTLTYQLGLFKYRQNQFEEAIPYLKQAFFENQECPELNLEYNIVNPQMYINTLALAYEKRGKLDSAEHHYQRALQFLGRKGAEYPHESHFITMARGVVKGNLGGVLYKKGHIQEAEKYLLESISLNDRPGFDKYDAQTAKMKLAELYLDSGQLEEAKDWIDELEVDMEAREGLSETNMNAFLRLSRLKWDYAEAIEDVGLAYQNMKAYQILYDSTERASLRGRYLDMEESFQHMEKEYQLSLISRDNQIKNIYLYVVVLLILAAGCLLFLVYRSLKKTKKFNRKISKQNMEFQEALEALEQSQAENTKMMHVVAHDLRNPISSITMISELLLDSTKLEGDDKTLLEHIKTSSENSLNLVGDILKGSNEQETIKKEPVELHQLLQYCVDLLKYKAEEKHQKVLLEVNEVIVPISREKMWRVVSNLVANAIKFSPSGEVIEVALRADKNKNVARISVADRGIGIPDELKDKIFEMFTEGRRMGTAGEETHGMGLAISKQIVKAHGGNLWFQPNKDKGTVFIVEIPL